MLILRETYLQANSHFHPADYPALRDSLAVLNERMVNFPILHKADLLIAFLKGQTMEDAWTSANPAVTTLLLSNSLPVQGLMSLFARSRNAELFSTELETYIRNWFKVTTTIY